jgi:hypothetical protein
MKNQQELSTFNPDQSSQSGMNRRQMVRRLLGSAGAAFALPGVGSAHPVHKHLRDAATLAEADAKVADAAWTSQFLDAHQNETLIVLAERIVPGSTRAQVNRFIDLLLSVDTVENQKRFINSLSAMDARALARFQHPFKALSEAEQNELLTEASSAGPSQEPDKDWSWSAVPMNRAAEQQPLTLRDHFDHLKGWISGAYYSSEIGMRELGWTPDVFFESFPGCEHPEGHH